MEKITVNTYGKVLESEKPPKKNIRTTLSFKGAGQDFMLLAMAFFYGQFSLFGMLRPFSIAFLASFFLEGYRFYTVLAVSLLSVAVSGLKGSMAKYVIFFLLSSLLNFILSSKMDRLTLRQKAVLGGVTATFAGILFAAVNGMSQFLSFMAVMEGIMALSLTYILGKGTDVLQNGLKRRILSTEEFVSLSLLAAGIVAGSSGIMIFQVPLKMVLAPFLILVLAYRGGAGLGCAGGVLMGFLLLSSGEGDMTLFFMLAVCGLVCGVLAGMGKAVICLSFFVVLGLTFFYMNSAFFTGGNFIAAACATGAFLILPKKFFAFLNTYSCYEKEIEEGDYMERYKSAAREKLKNFSDAFDTLARTFEKNEKKTKMEQKEIPKLMDELAAKVCNHCGVCTYCWETDFYNTYQVVFSALSVCEKRGRVTKGDILPHFVKSCVRIEQFVDTVNRIYERYRTNLLWENKITESRQLVSQQLEAVSMIIDSISEEIDIKPIFRQEIEKDIMTLADKKGIALREISVMENNRGILEMTLHCPLKKGRLACDTKEIIKLCQEATKKRLKKEKGHLSGEEGEGVIKLVEEGRLRVSSGVAISPKEEGGVSGDCYSFLELSDGSFVMALSDGMGSGQKANRESTTTIELLEKFVECGFEKDLAVKLINSVLVLKSNEDSFSTLDILSVNLYSGEGEFIKIGAAATYILREGQAKAVKSYSLPVGVLKTVEPETSRMVFKPGDIILMMTDGVADMIESRGDGIQWITDAFRDFQSRNPQDIADYVLGQAKKMASNEVGDDMTVFAARVWEK